MHAHSQKALDPYAFHALCVLVAHVSAPRPRRHLDRRQDRVVLRECGSEGGMSAREGGAADQPPLSAMLDEGPSVTGKNL